MEFLSLKVHYLHNEAIENLYYYKYFIIALVPFDLNLDGNFCDEMYKYVLDIAALSRKLVSLIHWKNDSFIRVKISKLAVKSSMKMRSIFKIWK